MESVVIDVLDATEDVVVACVVEVTAVGAVGLVFVVVSFSATELGR